MRGRNWSIWWQAWGDRADAVPVKEEVRRHAGDRSQATEGVGRGESAAQAVVADQALNLQVVKELLGKQW